MTSQQLTALDMGSVFSNVQARKLPAGNPSSERGWRRELIGREALQPRDREQVRNGPVTLHFPCDPTQFPGLVFGNTPFEPTKKPTFLDNLSRLLFSAKQIRPG